MKPKPPSPPASGTVSFGSETLKSSLLARGFTEVERAAVLAVMREETFSPGTDILTEGLNYQALWVVVSGRCEVVKRVNAAERQLAVLASGETFGEMSFFEQRPHSASVRAIESTVTLRLMAERWQELRTAQPAVLEKISLNMILLLTNRLRRMDEWTCQLVNNSGSKQQHAEWGDFRSKLYAGWKF